jgi:hypothetical protein
VAQHTTLIEPCFADALQAIVQATDLSPETRSQWASALRQIAKAQNKPLETLPARWTAARFNVGRLHHAMVGSNPKTLANQKSNVKAALLWFGKETGVPSRGAPLARDWQTLRNGLADRRRRAGLSALMRYCSANNIPPAAVDEGVINRFMRYRADTTSLAANDAARRAIARAWNACAGALEGWPSQRLLEPPVKSAAGPAWEDFPEGLRNDILNHLAGMTANPSPPSGWIEDFHLQALDHARHTRKSPAEAGHVLSLSGSFKSRSAAFKTRVAAERVPFVPRSAPDHRCFGHCAVSQPDLWKPPRQQPQGDKQHQSVRPCGTSGKARASGWRCRRRLVICYP